MKTIQMLWITLGIVLIASAAGAQSLNTGDLAKVRSLGIVIEDLNAAALRCGITKNGLDTSLRFIIGQSKIEIAKTALITDAKDGFIHLEVIVQNNCAALVSLSVYSNVTIQSSGKFAQAAIWTQNGIRTGGNASVDTKELVEEAAKMLVNDWNSVNK